MSKEDKRDISLIFPKGLLPFIPDVWMIVMGIATPENKKPRIYRDCSKKADPKTSRPANSIVKEETEPPITYGTAWVDFCQYIWNTRATFPSERILIWKDDEASCFNQKQFHPSVTSSMMTTFDNMICFAVGNHFGGNWGPADNEPVARAKERLCVYLYHQCNYQQALNKAVLDRVTISMTDLDQPLAQAKLEVPEKAQKTPKGEHQFFYRMYVDDSQTASLAHREQAHQMIASSVEATYLLRGFPGEMHQPFMTPTMAYDKVEYVVGTQEEILGITINSDNLRITMSKKKLTRLRDILSRHWNRRRKQFIARQAAQVVGNLLWCLRANGWLTPLCFSFTEMIRSALRRNGDRLMHTKHFQALFKETSTTWLEPYAGKKDARLLGLQHRYARALWSCKQTTWIPVGVHDHAEWLIQELDLALNTQSETWYKSLSHSIQRTADFVAYQDASSRQGAGGHSPDLKFWFQISWSEFGQEFNQWIINTLNEGGTTDAHINWLEYIASILNTGACVVTYQNRGTTLPWPPLIELIGDNNTANKAVGKGSAKTSNQVAGALARLQSNILRISEFGTITDRINTKDNEFADDLSRISEIEITAKIYKMTTHQRPYYLDPLKKTSTNLVSTTSYVRFHPSRELLSAICSAVRQPAVTGFSLIKNANDLGHISPGNNIFFDSYT